MTFVTIGIIGVLFLIVVSGLYVFVIGFVRKADIPWLVESEIRKTPFGKYYRQITDANQWLFDHNAQGLNIESHDGLKLHGLWVPAEDARGTILLVHGYRSTYLVDFAPAFAYYHKMGLNLLIPAQRAHGESGGKLITFGVKESQDMMLWCKYHNHHLSNCDIVLNGLSMGASTVLMASGKELPDNVIGILSDCGFSSGREIICHVAKRLKLPPVLIFPFIKLGARLFGRFDIDECPPKEALKNCKKPVLFFHGEADSFVPCYMSEENFDSCPTRKKLVTVPGAGHGLCYPVDQEKYLKELKEFFEV